MSYDKYYEEFYRDEKLNSRFITYLSAIDMQNKLLNRDKLKNSPIKDLCSNYAKKASMFSSVIKSSLGFIKDDIQVIYDYAINHLDSILEKPNQNIIKEQKLVSKEKIKQIEPKTFNWLANKPGISIKEKLAYVNKISSPVKRYTNNIKENQVTLSFFKDIYKILISKIFLIENNKDIFGEPNKEVIELKNKLNKLKYEFKNKFEEVIERDYTTPNNTLLGNKDYSVIWKSYLDLKQNILSYDNYFELYIKSFKLMFISLLMNNYNFVEQNLDFNNLFTNILYSVNNNVLKEITFENDDDFIITIKEYSLNEKVNLLNDNKYAIKFEELEEESNGGVSFDLYINDELLGIFNADNLGFHKAYFEICEFVSLNVNSIIKTTDAKEYIDWISLNSFDNLLCPSNKNLTATNDNSLYINNDLYFANKDTITLNDFNNSNYLSYLRLLRKDFEVRDNEYLIYDISDNYDEFSSTNLRRNISSVFNKSYPVWRSILAGESLDDKSKVEYVIDMCSKDKSIVVSKLERKNNRFVHCGAIETPIYLQNFNEYDFYKSYINKYEEKYLVSFPLEVVDEFIKSGKLNLLLQQKLDNIILLNGTINNHEYYTVKFDNKIFIDVRLEFIRTLRQITTYYGESKCITIVPNFLRILALKSSLFICNDDLNKGTKIISNRVKTNEVTWYEKLPKLSLEVIKNGMYDNLVLVDNQECENIIGKSFNITINETLTLSKGENNYILPLNKSFLGDNNESFVAIAEDKAFPLEEDVNVKLQLTYSFGSENSYLLKLIPIGFASFKSIDIKWEQKNIEENIINPIINDAIFSSRDLDELYNDKLPNMLKSFSIHINKIKRGEIISKNGRDNMKEALSDIQRLINYLQRLSAYSEQDKLRCKKLYNDNNVMEGIEFLRKKILTENSNNVFGLQNLEEAIVALTNDNNLFLKNGLKYPEACYGRYFSENPNDNLVLDNAYEYLIKLTQKDNYLNKNEFRTFINKMTSATACRHLVMLELTRTNPAFVKYLLKIILECLKVLSKYEWNQNVNKGSYNNNPKENGFLLRYCVELLISYLYCRKNVFLEELKPNGRTAKEIIYYLKLINKNLKIAMEFWDDDFKKKKMLKTKYHIVLQKPLELSNMWNEAYCLILCLSGDERANYIKIGGE